MQNLYSIREGQVLPEEAGQLHKRGSEREGGQAESWKALGLDVSEA